MKIELIHRLQDAGLTAIEAARVRLAQVGAADGPRHRGHGRHPAQARRRLSGAGAEPEGPGRGDREPVPMRSWCSAPRPRASRSATPTARSRRVSIFRAADGRSAHAAIASGLRVRGDISVSPRLPLRGRGGAPRKPSCASRGRPRRRWACYEINDLIDTIGTGTPGKSAAPCSKPSPQTHSRWTTSCRPLSRHLRPRAGEHLRPRSKWASGSTTPRSPVRRALHEPGSRR